jgi:hypothetical protein
MKAFLETFKILQRRPIRRASFRHNAFAFTPLREFVSLPSVDSNKTVSSAGSVEPSEQRNASQIHPESVIALGAAT